MASACVTNVSHENLPSTTFGWLSPRVSISSKSSNPDRKKKIQQDLKTLEPSDLEFEFSKGDVNEFNVMLSADELFSDGKLVPTFKQPPQGIPAAEVVKCSRTNAAHSNIVINNSEAYLFSPKAPRCSSRWRELLGLTKNNHNHKEKETTNCMNHNSSNNNNKALAYAKPIKLFRANPRSSTSSTTSSSDSPVSSISQPLLKEHFDTNEHCYSHPLHHQPQHPTHRHSLSSASSTSSSASDRPRLSLDTDKPRHPVHPGRVRTSRSGRTASRPDPASLTRGVSVDSPRMNPSGRVIFHGLERSSSSPSTFNSGRSKYNSHNGGRGMERSYSANLVRVTPVLNVPVCSSLRTGVFGFGSRKEKERECSTNGGGSSNGSSTNSKKRGVKLEF